MHIAGALPPLREARQGGDDRIDQRRIDSHHLEAGFEESLTGASGGGTQFDGSTSGLELDREGMDRLVEFEPGPRHLVTGDRPRIEAAWPAGGRRRGPVPPHPPPVVCVGEAVEDEITRPGSGERGPGEEIDQSGALGGEGNTRDELGGGHGADVARIEMDRIVAGGRETRPEGFDP